MQTFSIRESLKFGWDTFMKRPWFIIGAVVVAVIFSISFSYQSESAQEMKGMVPFLLPLNLVYAAISVAVEILFLRFLLLAHDSVTTMKYTDVLPARPYWKYIGGKIAASIIVIVGFILLIVPGVIASVALLFAPYLIVDRKMWPIEAMKESARITRGHRWKLLGLVLVIAGLNILGVLALFVGLLVTIPVSMLALVHVYRTLEHKASEVVPAKV